MSRASRALDGLGDVVLAVQRRSTWMRRWYLPVTAAGLTAIAVVAVFAMESTAPNYDPQYMRVLVERTMTAGGSYYSNGIHNKGPLEPFVYELAGWIGGPDGWWFMVSAFVLVAAMCVGLAAGVVAVRAHGSTLIGVCVATVAVVHLTLSDADYAGVLYARNITTALICIAIGVGAYGPAWRSERRRRIAVVVIGMASGLAVQTLLTAAFTASPVLVWAMWERRCERAWSRPAWLLMPCVAAAVFASAPLYYRLFGPWQDFVDGYWTHARFMSSGTGRGLGSQISLGWDQFLAYYGARPELVVLLAAWILVAGLRFRGSSGRDRALHAVVAAWWIGAWVELVLSQRYSSHYFSVLAVPTIMLLAVLLGDLHRWIAPLLRDRPWLTMLPLVLALVAIDIGGRTGADNGIDALSTVRSTADFADRREVGIDGRTRLVRATLDLVSEEGDPLLMWTSYPWPYLNLHRTSATRYIWKTFLVGEIYLGESGPQYVLPGTWEHFADDLADADPTAYLVESVTPIDPSTPFRTVVDERFTDVFDDGEVTLGLRRDLAAWLRSPPDEGVLFPAVEEGPFTAAPDGCVRLDGEFSPTATAPFVVELVGPDGAEAALVATPGGGEIVVESSLFGGNGWLRRIPIRGETAPLTLVAGDRSAVLLVDGEVAGAVEITSGTPVIIASGIGELTTRSATLSIPPPPTGC